MIANDNPKVPQVVRYCLLDDNTLEFRGSDGIVPIEEADFRLLFVRREQGR